LLSSIGRLSVCKNEMIPSVAAMIKATTLNATRLTAAIFARIRWILTIFKSFTKTRTSSYVASPTSSPGNKRSSRTSSSPVPIKIQETAS
jgi:hypothetical protein